MDGSVIIGAVAYREWRPAWLPDGVRCLWVHEAEADGEARILPDACADLVWRAGSGLHVAGPDTTASVFPVRQGDVIVGARFAPGAGGPALGVPLDAVRDVRVPALALPTAEAKAAECGWDRIEPPLPRRGGASALDVPGDLVPDDALRRVAAAAVHAVGTAPPDRAVLEAARRLRDPRQRVDALAADLGLSDRQLRRRSLAAAGHTPKVLQRILRFRSFVAAADAQPDADLARLAAEHGYADQAHLTGECTALAGLPPAALRRVRGR